MMSCLYHRIKTLTRGEISKTAIFDLKDNEKRRKIKDLIKMLVVSKYDV